MSGGGSRHRCRGRTRPEPVAMANRRRGAGTGGAAARPTASTQAFQRRCTARRSSPTRSSSSLKVANADRAFAGTSVGNRDNAAVSSRIHTSSARRGRNAVQHDRPPEVEAGADASHILPPLAPSCSTSSASTSLARMRPDASFSRYRDSARNGSRPSVRRRARPPLRTAGARRRAACCGG